MTSRVDRNSPGVQLSYDGGCRARFFICSLLCNGMYICRVMSIPGIIVQFLISRRRATDCSEIVNCILFIVVTAECAPPPSGAGLMQHYSAPGLSDRTGAEGIGADVCSLLCGY